MCRHFAGVKLNSIEPPRPAAVAPSFTPLPGAQGRASECIGGKTLRNLKTIEQISRNMTLWISRYGRDVLSRNSQLVANCKSAAVPDKACIDPLHYLL